MKITPGDVIEADCGCIILYNGPSGWKNLGVGRGLKISKECLHDTPAKDKMHFHYDRVVRIVPKAEATMYAL